MQTSLINEPPPALSAIKREEKLLEEAFARDLIRAGAPLPEERR